jgi:hypothetical protein
MKEPLKSGVRQFFPLTQVCKQIRTEYRPLWLRGSYIRLSVHDLPRWFNTFYPHTIDLKHAPKNLQISWWHEEDDEEDLVLDITPLIQLRAHCPTFDVSFIPHKVAEHIFPKPELCEACEERMMMLIDCDTSEDEDAEYEMELLDLCECDGEFQEFHYKDYEIDCTDEIAYTEDLKAFIMNDNEAWLEDNRNARPQIRCSHDCEKGQYTFTISFCRFHGKAPKILRRSSPNKNKDACQYLNNRGILKLEGEWGGTIEMGVNLLFQTGKVSKTRGHIIESSLMHEIYVMTRDGDDDETE